MVQANHLNSGGTRFDGIDLLRGCSIIAVMNLHILMLVDLHGPHLTAIFSPWLLHLFFLNGLNGVKVFFAVSGFLITTTSIRRFGNLARMKPAVFYRIRFARIAPLMLAVLAVLSLLHLAGVDSFVIPAERASLPRALFAALTFHLNWLEAERGFLPLNWDVLWSLSVEEVFYLFFPLVCVLVLRLREGRLIFTGVLCLFVLMGPLARAAWTTNEIWRFKSYLGNMDAIALGCLCALWTDQRIRNGELVSVRTLKWRLFEAVGYGIMFVLAAWPPGTGIDGTVLPMGTCFALAGSVLRGKVGGMWGAPLRWLGRNSYELYLIHWFLIIPLVGLYLRWTFGPVLLWVLGIVFTAGILGHLISVHFSEPLNRWLRAATLQPTRGPSPPQPAME